MELHSFSMFLCETNHISLNEWHCYLLVDVKNKLYYLVTNQDFILSFYIRRYGVYMAYASVANLQHM